MIDGQSFRPHQRLEEKRKKKKRQETMRKSEDEPLVPNLLFPQFWSIRTEAKKVDQKMHGTKLSLILKISPPTNDFMTVRNRCIPASTIQRPGTLVRRRL